MIEPASDDEIAQLVIQAPLDHQLTDFEAPYRFKLERKGRRWGKSRFDFIAAVIGHGPGWREHKPMFEGIAQGRDVCWLGKNNPQTAQIWLEEVYPRFKDVDGVDVDKTHRRVTLEGAGSLHVRSAEAISTVRGIGANLIGLICDEAAWWAWLHGWRTELRPILMDNEGWAIISSTTNAGYDGEVNELGDKVSPSGFNRRCEEVMLGRPGFTREDGWYHSHGTARENPKISPKEFAATLKEYVPGSISLEQEMEAKLVAGGSGVAFPEWRDDVHIVRMEAPGDAIWMGSMDWGYDPDPCVYYSVASFGDRRLHWRHERVWRKTDPYKVGFQLGEQLKGRPAHTWIACDASMDARTTGPSIMEEVQRGLNDSMRDRAPTCIQAPAGEKQRPARKLLLHEGLAFEERPAGDVYDHADPELLSPEDLLALEVLVVPPWLAPKFSFHPDCVEWIASVPKLQRSPKGKEDVDTEGYDHPYDGGTYLLTCRGQQDRTDDRDELGGLTRDTHPGFTHDLQRKDPWHGPRPSSKAPYRSGIRYRFRRPDEEENDE